MKFGVYTNDTRATSSEALPENYDAESASQIQTEQESQVRNDPVPVPEDTTPFLDDDTEHQFLARLQDLVERDYIPVGYGLLPEEWEGNAYSLFETLRVGRRSGKELRISLVDPVWMHRAILWVQGLYLLTQFLQ